MGRRSEVAGYWAQMRSWLQYGRTLWHTILFSLSKDNEVSFYFRIEGHVYRHRYPSAGEVQRCHLWPDYILSDPWLLQRQRRWVSTLADMNHSLPCRTVALPHANQMNSTSLKREGPNMTIPALSRNGETATQWLHHGLQYFVGCPIKLVWNS